MQTKYERAAEGFLGLVTPGALLDEYVGNPSTSTGFESQALRGHFANAISPATSPALDTNPRAANRVPDIICSRPRLWKKPDKRDGVKQAFPDVFDARGCLEEDSSSYAEVADTAQRFLVAAQCDVGFVVTLFGRNTARISCFKRAGFVATDAFDWLVNNDVFPTFLYRLYNPRQLDIPRFNGVRSSIVLVEKVFDLMQSYQVLLRDPVYNRMFANPQSASDSTLFIQTVRKLPGGPRTSRCLELIPIANLAAAWNNLFPRNDLYASNQLYAKSVVLRIIFQESLPIQSSATLPPQHAICLLRTIGGPLATSRSPEALFRGMTTAILGYQRALQAGVMHGDITAANIIVDDPPIDQPARAILLDFDDPGTPYKFPGRIQNRGKKR
ncbi:hypothetical protein C8F01DRAFT_542478 [Mycena amicta]|nr:hypothetical protein C8F01DRAFT_542478 [Mycena amicta]